MLDILKDSSLIIYVTTENGKLFFYRFTNEVKFSHLEIGKKNSQKRKLSSAKTHVGQHVDSFHSNWYKLS